MKVTCLFVDMNSYFASVEQQDDPLLRGQPVAVAPVMAETSCCIAASYEAKRFGVKTGTRLSEARLMCPGLVIRPARVETYVRYHNKIVEAVNSVLPVKQVHSIDEMSARLTCEQTQPDHAMLLGAKVKQAIREHVGEALKCSVGISTNRFLAKIATDLQKPDGLTLLTPEMIPERLYSLALQDFPGIGSRMEIRLRRAGIFTVEQMYQCSEAQLKRIWGGINGNRWWYLIRGHHVSESPTRKRSVGQSHVLPPEFRSDTGVRAVMVKLIAKAARRLRLVEYWTGRLTIQVQYYDHGWWEQSAKFPPCQDTQSLLEVFTRLWQRRPQGPAYKPLKAAMLLTDLSSGHSTPQSLLPSDHKRCEVSKTMDAINNRFGRDKLYLAAMHDAHTAAPARIAFTRIPDAIEFDFHPLSDEFVGED